MKRIHVVEFEDLSWFPNWIRKCMTRLIVVMHNMLGTGKVLAELVARVLKESNTDQIVDLCAGAGGPMLDVLDILEKEHGMKDVQLTLTDLYPNQEFAAEVNSGSKPHVSYETKPIDATNVAGELKGLRTMVSSFHHMRPAQARKILENAKDSGEPICIFEISDNSFPVFIWWIAIPINFLMSFFVTLMVRPMTWQQIVFTYLIPIIPFFFAWDGAVSNARTYTLNDMDELLEGLESDDYKWEKGMVKGRSKNLYLLGLPQKS